MLQHRAEDGEQDDVGGGHVEGDAEDPFERHVECAHDPGKIVAAVSKQPKSNELQQPAVVAVRQKDERRHRQDPPYRPPGRLEHKKRYHGAEREIRYRGCGRSVHELIEVDDRPRQRRDGERGEYPVERGDALASGTSGGIQEKREDEG